MFCEKRSIQNKVQIYARKKIKLHLYMNDTGLTVEKEGNPTETESALADLRH